MDAARQAITTLLTTTNHMKQLTARTTLVQMITDSIHTEIYARSESARNQRRRLTSNSYPRLEPALAAKIKE